MALNLYVLLNVCVDSVPFVVDLSSLWDFGKSQEAAAKRVSYAQEYLSIQTREQNVKYEWHMGLDSAIRPLPSSQRAFLTSHLSRAQQRVDRILLAQDRTDDQRRRDAEEFKSYMCSALRIALFATRQATTFPNALPPRFFDMFQKLDCGNRCEIITSITEHRFSITPDPATAYVGQSVVWLVSNQDYAASKVRWTAYFDHGSPFGDARQDTLSTITSRDDTEKNGEAQEGVIGPATPTKEGEYKYGLKSENAVSDEELDDDDPMLIIRLRNE